MDRETIEKLGRRLESRMPLVGGMLRRSACRKLAEDSSSAAVPHLVKALDSEDETVRDAAQSALRSLVDPGAVDALCGIWFKNRDERLGTIIAECQYKPHGSGKLKLAALFKSGRKVRFRTPTAGAMAMVWDLSRDEDPRIAASARASLADLKAPAAVDALCTLWREERDQTIGKLVAECGYVAREPVRVRVLSALKAGRPEPVGEGAEQVPHLVDALLDSGTAIADNAEVALRCLQNAGAIDALCDVAISDPQSVCAEIVKQERYEPEMVSRRCVLFLLTGQLEKYFDLDHESQHLKAEYAAGDETLKRHIGEAIRASGDDRLLGLFHSARRRKLARELTAHEAQILLDVHERNEQWEEIFSLLFHIPLSKVVVGLDLLEKAGWQPEEETEAGVLGQLQELRGRVGDAPERPPAPDVALGPVMGGWIENGRAMAEEADDALRERMARGDPLEAVAALAALATSGTGNGRQRGRGPLPSALAAAAGLPGTVRGPSAVRLRRGAGGRRRAGNCGCSALGLLRWMPPPGAAAPWC
jgi:hypothetical protein